MRKWFLSLVLVLAWDARAGHEIRNGGDVIRCNPTDDFVSLDYMLTRNLFGDQVKLAKATNARSSLERISELIANKLPGLSSSFSTFISNLDNESDSSLVYLWQPAHGGLPDIEDEAIAYLPYYCQIGNLGAVELEQVVIREDKSESSNPSDQRIVFHFDQSLFSKLDSRQQSFVLVHEWLWSISTNVQQNRKINYFLHSELFDQVSPADAARQMQEFGVNE